MEIRFSVACVPVPQPRQRHSIVSTGGRTLVQNYTPKRDPVNSFKAAVAHEAKLAYSGPPIEGPIFLEVLFLFPRPGRLMFKKKPMPREPHTGRPDCENVVKALQDCLSGVIFRDDAQIYQLLATKLYAAGDERPGVEAVIRTIS